MTTTDPVCGMPVTESGGVTLQLGATLLGFCSDFCKREFERSPVAYGAEPAEERHPVELSQRRIAYFSMEIALESAIPTYAGGLGVLAGDTMRSCADLEVPAVAVTLLHRRGYNRQRIVDGAQVDSESPWVPESSLRALETVVSVEVDGRPVRVRGWLTHLVGSSGYEIPVILLDTALEENDAWDRRLTDRLYAGDGWYRLCQEVVLGVGGVRMLRALGCAGINTWHLNEGHAAFAPLELLSESHESEDWRFANIRRQCVFTTHTAVPSGHDAFECAAVERALGRRVPPEVLRMLGGGERFSMTSLALALSHYVNGVALRHREVSSSMFPGYEIHQITNGVHSTTWTSAPFKALFDRSIPGWRADPSMLRNAIALRPDDVWDAHLAAKRALLSLVVARTGVELRPEALTIGFARRAATYKRSALVFSNRDWLRELAFRWPLQFVFAGKAHPADEPGKAAIRTILETAKALEHDIRIIYLEDYDMDLALSLVSGVDLWLNTPRVPLEASGTSGMKAAHNGVPSLSTLDGWWVEGLVEGATGWGIASPPDTRSDQIDADDATALYQKLQHAILPMFFDDRDGWLRVMRQTVALNASFFNSHRMVRQYVQHAYGRIARVEVPTDRRR